ncbi:MAG: DoxX family membrane protein [Myxococcota bacterium]
MGSLMVPFFVLLSTFVLFLILGRWVASLTPWPNALRLSLATMFWMTASAHWGSRRADLVQMVPDLFPEPELIVTLTGIAEVAGAIGLLVPRTAPYAAGALAILLLAMFPANVHAALEGLSIGGEAVTPLLPRTLIQIVFIVACLVAGFAKTEVPEAADGRLSERNPQGPMGPDRPM